MDLYVHLPLYACGFAKGTVTPAHHAMQNVYWFYMGHPRRPEHSPIHSSLDKDIGVARVAAVAVEGPTTGEEQAGGTVHS